MSARPPLPRVPPVGPDGRVAPRGEEEPPAARGDDAWETPAVRPRRGLALLIVLLLGLAGLGVVRGVTASPAAPETPAEEADGRLPAPEGAPSGATGALAVDEADAADGLARPVRGVLEGVSTPLPPAPLTPRLYPATAAVDGALLVWGGTDARGLALAPDAALADDRPLAMLYGNSGVLADGARYDVASGQWSPMAASPLYNRASPLAVGLGQGRVAMWGGRGLQGWYPDGAVYDARTDTWTPMAPAPLIPREFPVAAWTGAELVIFGGLDPSDRTSAVPDGAAWNPMTDTWRPLAPPPAWARLAGRTEVTAAWDGRAVVVWDGRVALEWDPETDVWATSVPDREVSGLPGDLVRTERGLVAADAYPHVGGPGARLGWGLVRDGERWGQTSQGPLDVEEPHRAVEADGRVVVLPADAIGSTGAGAIWDPAADAWLGLPDDAAAPRRLQALAWVGGSLLSWGGLDAEGRPVLDGTVWRPRG